MTLLYGFEIACLLVALICAVAIPKIRRNLLYCIIPANVLADSLTLLSSEDDVLHSGLARIPLFIVVLLVYGHKVRFDPFTVTIASFLIYLAALIPFSSHMAESLRIFGKVSFSLSMIPIAAYAVTSEEEFRKLRVSLVVAFMMVLAEFALAQFFHLGEQAYSEQSAFFGGGGIYVTYVLTYGLIFAPITLPAIPAHLRYPLSVMYVIGGLVVVTSFRRGSIVALFLGYAILFGFGGWGQRRRIMMYAAVACVGFIALWPMYSGVLSELFERRVAVVGRNFEFGNRVMETKIVWYELMNKSAKHTWFGTELFNSGEYFRRYTTSGKDRPLHVDFNTLLHGSGVIGLSLYCLLFGRILLRFVACHRRWHSRGERLARLQSTSVALLLAGCILSMSQQLWVMTSYSCFCILLGAMLRMTQFSAVQELMSSQPAMCLKQISSQEECEAAISDE